MDSAPVQAAPAVPAPAPAVPDSKAKDIPK
jgi:hypothetical protein